MTNSIQSFVHDPHTAISSEETFYLERLESNDNMFNQYYMHSDMLSMLKRSHNLWIFCSELCLFHGC